MAGQAPPGGALPPNFFDPTPLANSPETILGVSITFIVVCWMAIGARLGVRFFITKTPGWDDLFIVLSMLIVSAGGIAFCVSTRYGMGTHIYLIPPEDLGSFLKCFYILTASYNTSTALIKISLLLQYIRVFDWGTWSRRISQALVVLIALWGAAFAFMAWFPCLPHPSNAWVFQNQRAGCYGGFSTDPLTVVAFIKAHGGSNLGLDILILALAFKLLLARDVQVTLAGKAVLLTMGTVSCSFAIWRLAEVVASQGGQGGDDISWMLPEPTLLSFCEIYIATLVASIPFFWPIISEQLSKIFVKYEFNVSVESRYYQTDNGDDDDVELTPASKTKSVTTVDDVTEPAKTATKQGKQTHYQDDFVQHMVDPFGEQYRTDTSAKPQPASSLKQKASFSRQ
ncbi:hypothetical protein GE09DRAFT_1065992 [Coniochaeta sp. 2T2.1]|nr:hypothetical protein GE09DRAFT_1065992 [Coniochaeta sp. 2T2.1]